MVIPGAILTTEPNSDAATDGLIKTFECDKLSGDNSFETVLFLKTTNALEVDLQLALRVSVNSNEN